MKTADKCKIGDMYGVDSVIFLIYNDYSRGRKNSVLCIGALGFWSPQDGSPYAEMDFDTCHYLGNIKGKELAKELLGANSDDN